MSRPTRTPLQTAQRRLHQLLIVLAIAAWLFTIIHKQGSDVIVPDPFTYY